MSKRPISVCSRAGVGQQRLARAAQLDRVLLLAFGDGLVGQIGDAVPDLLPLSLGRRQLVVERLELALEALRLLDLLGRGGLAEPLLLRAHLVAAGARVPPAGIGREQRVEELGGATARERGAKRVGLGSSGAEVDHARESRSASITCATPSSSTEGQTKSATASTRRCAFATATP